MDKLFSEKLECIDRNTFAGARRAACFTMETDVLPRYQDSDLFVEFKAKVDGHIPPIAGIAPDGSSVDTIATAVDLQDWKPVFSLDDVMSDRILYPFFEKQLKHQLQESICVLTRLILIFKAHVADEDMASARDTAWTILVNFLHENSPSKIEFTNARMWRSVCMTVASPNDTAFDELRDAARPKLEQQFSVFQASADYEIMGGVMELELKKRNADIKANVHIKRSRRGSRGFCFVFCLSSSTDLCVRCF